MAQKTRAEIEAAIDALLTDNNNRQITGEAMNALLQDIKDSILFTDEVSGTDPVAGTITDQSLTNGVFTINHNLNSDYVKILLYDSNGYMTGPAQVSIRKTSVNAHTVNFGGAITETYTYVAKKIA